MRCWDALLIESDLIRKFMWAADNLNGWTSRSIDWLASGMSIFHFHKVILNFFAKKRTTSRITNHCSLRKSMSLLALSCWYFCHSTSLGQFIAGFISILKQLKANLIPPYHPRSFFGTMASSLNMEPLPFAQSVGSSWFIYVLMVKDPRKKEKNTETTYRCPNEWISPWETQKKSSAMLTPGSRRCACCSTEVWGSTVPLLAASPEIIPHGITIYDPS